MRRGIQRASWAACLVMGLLASAAGQDSSRLSDQALQELAAPIARRIRSKLSEKQLEPLLYKDLLAQLAALIARSETPAGEACCALRIFKGNTELELGLWESAELEARAVLKFAPSSRVVEEALTALSRLAFNRADSGALKELIGEAERRSCSETLQHGLRSYSLVLQARELSQKNDPDGIERLAREAEGLKVEAEVVELLRRQKARCALAPGQEFPDFAAADVTGKLQSIKAMRGRVLVIEFWASWCVPSRRELPVVVARCKEREKAGLSLWTVSLDPSKAQMEDIAGRIGSEMTIFFDGLAWKTPLAVAALIESLPSRIVIGRDGRVVALDPSLKELPGLLDRALRGS